MFDLAGRVAIVTGGGRGIGAEYCQTLAKHGAAVVAADIDQAGAKSLAGRIKDTGGKAGFCQLEVADQKSVNEAIKYTVQEFGGVDIVINNAAMYANLTRRLYDQITPEEFDRVMAVNVKGIWLTTVAAVPHMKSRGKGKIINIGSSSIFAAGNRLVHYVASKMAVIGLTRALARELGPFNICVNTLMPGLTDSETNRKNMTPELAESEAQGRCFKRIQVPADLMGAALFLASDASDFMTGQSIVVDGGLRFN